MCIRDRFTSVRNDIKKDRRECRSFGVTICYLVRLLAKPFPSFLTALSLRRRLARTSGPMVEPSAVAASQEFARVRADSASILICAGDIIVLLKKC